MTKTELIKALEAIPDDVIVLTASNGYDSWTMPEVTYATVQEVELMLKADGTIHYLPKNLFGTGKGLELGLKSVIVIG